jgi:hypothetical protein
MVYARLTQLIIPSWYLAPGVSLRFAENETETSNTRDYQNYDLSLIYAPSRSFSATVTYEYWAVEEGDRFSGVSGELRYRHGRLWEISGGASYAKYTYDVFSDFSFVANGGQTIFTEEGTVIRESPYVFTYFLRGRWRITPKLIVRLQGDVEDNDETDDLSYRGRASFEVRF